MERPALLFLCHRIPYPPNKGDKIRSWHLLRHLADRHRIHLAAFVDDPDDWRHRDALEAVCEAVRLRPLHKRRACLRGLPGLLGGRSLSVACYADRSLRDWVAAQVRKADIRRVVVYSSAMAQYVDPRWRWERALIDFVDVDADKWRQYAEKQRWPWSWIYRREAEALLRHDRAAAARFDASLFVSEPEAALFRRLAPEVADRVDFYPNGVDAGYFAPERAGESPHGAGGPVVVFTGAMDYWPNVDAVVWFADEVLPRVRARHPDTRFCIVGAHPAEAVRALGARAGIHVTGRVEDVRPWLGHAALAVAPMRVARGIQNKVLEAMAMARPVVVSPQGLEGIEARIGEELLCAADADAFAEAVVRVLDGAHPRMGERARRRVLEHYSWPAALARVDRLLED